VRAVEQPWSISSHSPARRHGAGIQSRNRTLSSAPIRIVRQTLHLKDAYLPGGSWDSRRRFECGGRPSSPPRQRSLQSLHARERHSEFPTFMALD
jgi:hypothetical protein